MKLPSPTDYLAALRETGHIPNFGICVTGRARGTLREEQPLPNQAKP